ncbi:MAG: glycosyltransferase family 9 protein, partial [Gemmatimonadaceae bacterium]
MTVDRAQFRDAGRYRLALLSELGAPLLRAAARATSRGTPVPPEQWRTGVILGNGHIGDVLYRTCSLDLLRRGLPQCQWSYLTTPLGAALLERNPSIHNVLPWMLDRDPERIAPDRYAELKSRNFDVALCTENVQHHRALLLALRLGIPNRVAFTGKGLSGLTTFGVDLPRPLSRPAQFRYMVQRLTGLADTPPLRPHAFPSEADRIAASAEWSRLQLPTAALVIACSATTRQRIGDFPPTLFTAILRDALASAPEAYVLLAGSADDAGVLAAMARELGERTVVSAGVLSVLGYESLLGRCAAFIGADSGPRHLANAAGIPV